MLDDDEFDFDDDELDTDSDSADDDDEFDEDELDEEARLAEAREIAKLKWEIEGLKEVHRTLREHYRTEMHALIEPLVDKHRQLKGENRQLQVDLAEATQARIDADSGIKQEIADLRAAHAALLDRSDLLEEDNRLGRRLQAELSDADSKIAKLESEIADLERDCRRQEHFLAEHDREHEALRQQIAQTEAKGREWQQQYEQTLADNAAELAMYQDQISETAEQTTVLEMRAQEFTQMDHLLPELYTTLRAEKATIDGIEALLFPQEPEPEPVLAAVGAGGGDEPPAAWEAAGPALGGSAPELAWDAEAGTDSETLDAQADAVAWQAEEGGESYQELAQELSWPDEAGDLPLVTDDWDPTALAPGQIVDEAIDEPLAGSSLDDAFAVEEIGLTDEMAAWQADEAGDGADAWAVPPEAGPADVLDEEQRHRQRQKDEMLAFGMPSDGAFELAAGIEDEQDEQQRLQQRQRDEMLAFGLPVDAPADRPARGDVPDSWGMVADLSPDDRGTATTGGWQTADGSEAWELDPTAVGMVAATGSPHAVGIPDDDTPYAEDLTDDVPVSSGGAGLAIPDLDGPSVGAVAIPGFDAPQPAPGEP
jgi:hypothetical protein